MSHMPAAMTGTVERLPTASASVVTDELNRIFSMLRDIAPRDATISFDFDGQLHAHIDVKKREHVTVLETVLPAVGGGLFQDLRLSGTPNRPFCHRLSAIIAS
jgi:hypothetical protein